ncbi:MAG: YciI family protein [Gammaproteobacteria bacterium]
MTKTLAVFFRHGSQWNRDLPVRGQAYWDEHAIFMDELFESGAVILGGPFADGSGSMVILTAESAEAARTIFQEDPWTRLDILVVDEVKEWTIFLDARARSC